ncbi:thiamine-phosphate kinase [Myxococcota bacterium]|nr:thiamine-phosphate kinase [Myxococcota bacterium]
MTAGPTLPEDDLVARLISLWPRPGRPGLRVGPGDDCAVVEGDRVVTADLLLEGVHFRRDWASDAEIGWKAMAANLSDLAAAGAEPTEAVVTLALPTAGEDVATAIYRGMASLARVHGVALAGGDTCAWGGPLVVSITAFGRPVGSGPPGRGGARRGDNVYVSGNVGLSSLGLRALSAWGRAEAEARQPAAVARHLRPEPRIALGRRLVESRAATAMMDLSDGLSTDLLRLCRASGVGIEIDLDALPLHPEVAALGDALDLAVNGGEDYELVFCSPESPESLASLAGPEVAVTRIGRVVGGPPEVRTRRGGGPAHPLPARGWDPFRP